MAVEIRVLLADRLRALRKARGLTQEEAAVLVGCDYKYYQLLEGRTGDLKLSTVQKLANAFRVPIADLFREG